MEIKQAIANAFEEEVASLQGLLRIKSVEALGENGTVFGQGAADCLAYVLKLGEKMGFAARDVDGYCGYLEYGAGEELVTVLGHLDVVPEGTGWTYPPYAAEIHDGKIYARGAIDDKGPMVAAMYALKAVKESGVALKRRVRLLFGLNEETGCACMKHYVEKGEELPAFGFTPDGDFPDHPRREGHLHGALSPRAAPRHARDHALYRRHGAQRRARGGGRRAQL
ncbi:MAG: Sapep family Mn(2+)-dependent dipeptidase, partial [Oscillospiraceae bacterium]|nr:Sapep family Mn(2+)-dependent dipeptidase [Oscillospiraceae bacterium]